DILLSKERCRDNVVLATPVGFHEVSLFTSHPQYRTLFMRESIKSFSDNYKTEEKIAEIENRIEDNLFIDSSVPNMDALTDFLVRQVLRTTSEYYDVKVIIVDSIQGLGTASTSSRPYMKLFEFCRHAKEHGITCLLIGHVTKSGQIAGPKTLEHNVDCIMYIRKAMRLRPFFVPKNRFGPERHEPFSLIMNKWGCIEKSKHMSALASLAFGYLPRSNRVIEVQALVKLPKFGSKAGILAPYLPRPKLQQVIGIVSSIKDVDISDLTFEINCYIPAGGIYSHILDFPLAVSMLSSYFQRIIPSGSLFIGELDLTQQIRPLQNNLELEQLANFLATDDNNSIKKIFISHKQVDVLSSILSDKGASIQVVGVSDLQSFITTIWPDLIENQENPC
ncbi:MAG: hypothetical protein AB1632_15130, partial [Nitrospirota bacterium]